MSDNGLPIVARRLREARVRKGLSQKALGIAAGIHVDSASPRINQYEQGKHAPDFLTIKNLASVLGVPVPYFYSEDELLAELLILLNSLLRPQQEEVKKYLVRKMTRK
ncbi:XRE family transcriptional regulator [Georgfuchsia toluolica]|uniref:XRE family transcriptional regulator n=1 Tax=Georgfuchsia toluolica TaxID=424218 RepID=A0A916NI35_9PROT|nr:helix-turn-helix transcriptional regulator [Georgfuchsia toluolica]CAG4884066.1 XRE family transcriptional regulator [Georgfuchsia toluolica]